MSSTLPLPEVDVSRCTFCGLCVAACPCQSVRLESQGPVFSCPESCAGIAGSDNCCSCDEVCPTRAITRAFQIISAFSDEE
jgi:formate hydrogenlyase subunit 6/NADH:ubiquinone oxidoreductase subunit I